MNGKIYTIRHPETDKYYIGSTTQSLSKRLAKHKSNLNNKYVSASKLLFDLGVDDCYIELLENYPCNTKEELNKKEGELIRLHKDNTVNKRIEGRTLKEYRTENKEIIKDRKKQYREANKEQIIEKKKVYYQANKEHILNLQKQLYTCDCGATIRHCEKPRHNKSKKHLKFMEI